MQNNTDKNETQNEQKLKLKDTFRIGNAYFKRSFQNYFIANSSSEKIQKIISSLHKSSMLVCDEQEIKDWKIIFLQMLILRCEQITFKYQVNLGLLGSIYNIKFENLKSLQLSQNQIKNIESLCRFDMNNLQTVNLSFNKITNLKSAIKCFNRQIRKFDFRQNPIASLDNNQNQITKKINVHFAEIGQGSKVYQYKAGMRMKPRPRTPLVQIQDLSLYLSLMEKNVSIYRTTEQSDSIEQAKILKMLKRKYPELKMLVDYNEQQIQLG